MTIGVGKKILAADILAIQAAAASAAAEATAAAAVANTAAANASAAAAAASTALASANASHSVIGQDATGALVTPVPPFGTGAPLPLGAFAGLTANLGTMGWKGDGGAGDLAIVNAAYTAAPNGATIHIPAGFWPGDPTVDFSANFYSTKHVTWIADGPLYQGTSGSTFVEYIGDGDAFVCSRNGGQVVSKRHLTTADNNGGNGGAPSSVIVLNSSPNFANGESVVWGQSFTYISGLSSTGETGGFTVTLISNGNNGLGAQDTGHVVRVNNIGQNAAFAREIDFENMTGFPPITFANALEEKDFKGNGPDPQGGGVGTLYTVNSMPHQIGWQPFQHVQARGETTGATVIIVTPPGAPEPHTFVCIQGGQTGGTMPNFTVPTYPSTPIFNDNGAKWKYGTTVRCGFDKMRWIGITAPNSVNHIDLITGQINNAAQDLTGAVFAGNAVAYSLPPGGLVNFSGLPFPNQWKPNAPVTLGTQVIPHDNQGLVMFCTAPGTTGASQPSWPTTPSGTVTETTGVAWAVFNGGRKWGYQLGGLSYTTNLTGYFNATVDAMLISDAGAMTLAGGLGIFGKAPPAVAPIISGSRAGASPFVLSIYAALVATGFQDQSTP